MKSLSLIGMSKNAGKTTALNSILSGYFNSPTILGLTSIGRDGEDLDIVTQTSKPRIYVKQGTIFATTASLLRACDVTKEILMTTGINTPLGEVILLRALSGGYVQLAGPSINKQVMWLCDAFRSFGAEFIIVDGAFARKTLASPTVTDRAILCTGASLSKSMRRVLTETWHIHELLNLPRVSCDLEQLSEGFPLAAITDNGSCQGYEQAALTDSLANDLIKQGNKISKIIADDGSKFLIGTETHRKLSLRGIELMVRNKTELVAVTINPFSAYGYEFDGGEFKKQLTEMISTPVINVMQEGFALYELLERATKK